MEGGDRFDRAVGLCSTIIDESTLNGRQIMIGSEGFVFAVTSLLFFVFLFGVVMAFEGIVGRDVDLFIDVWGKRSNRWGPDSDRPLHPPTRHCLLRVGTGVSLMAIAVLLAIIII